MPGVSNVALPITLSFRSSFTILFSPISVTYQYEPSGSTCTWCGFAFALKPRVLRSTVRRTVFVVASMRVTVASFWFVTYRSAGERAVEGVGEGEGLVPWAEGCWAEGVAQPAAA